MKISLLILFTSAAILFGAVAKDAALCPKDKKGCATSAQCSKDKKNCQKTENCPHKDSTGKCPMMKESAAPVPATGQKVLTEQKTCPIMGGAINKKYFIDYDGKRIYMCCPGCTDALKKDPKAAIQKLKSLGEAAENLASSK